jgi:hypothetical protein
MTSESTYQPNFVINEEDNTSPEQKEFEEGLKSIPPTKVAKEEASIKLIDREVEFIEGQRSKLRLFDPKDVYFYRHITINYFQSVFHFISLLISCSVIFLLIGLGYSESQTIVKGIGWVSNITTIEKMINVFTVIFFIYQLRKLFNLQGLSGLKRYKLAMLANSINLTVINFIKVIILFSALLMFTLIISDPNENINVILSRLSNGVFFDVINAFFLLVGVVIFVLAFRFCSKGVEE